MTPWPSQPLEDLLKRRTEAALSRWREPEDDPELIRHGLARLPSDLRLGQVVELAKCALGAAASETAISQAVGALVEAYLPGRAGAPVVYAETLIDLAYRDGFPPAVVAEARERILRSDTKFAPAPGEWLAACRGAFAELQRIARAAEQAMAARATAVEILRRIDLQAGSPHRTTPPQSVKEA